MRAFVALVIVTIVTSAPTHNFAEEDLMQVVEKLRGVTGDEMSYHAGIISEHAALIQKAKAYAHNFDESRDAIRSALKSLSSQLSAGHDHDKAALANAKAIAEATINKSRIEGKTKTRHYRNKACPSKRSEEDADRKKAAAKKAMTDIQNTKICGKLGTTWRDMDIEKSVPTYGSELRNAWDKNRSSWVSLKSKFDAAAKAHEDAIRTHNGVMAKFNTALELEISAADTTCKNSHKEYEALTKEVASNVVSRKQVYIATLVVNCYIENLGDNTAAKTCADKSRAATTTKWDITPSKLAACPDKTTLARDFGPSGWKPTVQNCKLE